MLKIICFIALAITATDCFPETNLKVTLHKFNPNYGKIVGGTEVEPNSIPHQISFQTHLGSHICGGSIINENTILTAAHCCLPLNPSRTRIVAGEHDLRVKSGYEQIREIIKLTSHENFGIGGPTNDVCIIKLKDKLEFNDKVSAVTLPEQEQEFTGDVVTSGWGTTAQLGPDSPVLQSANLQIVSPEKCGKAYPNTIDESMICAGADGKGACQGDSGGPMNCGEDKIHCGVVSFGRGCGEVEYPGVFARTSHFIDWINDLA